jgi:hypothetical protein
VSTDWQSAFDNFGIKEVTKTDIAKSAFVPTAEQKWAISQAGFEPGAGGQNAILLNVHVFDDPAYDALETSYYNSMRRSDPSRTPETRMGRDFIRWVQLGDLVAIGNLGTKVFAWKMTSKELPLSDTATKIAATANKTDILDKARSVQGKPSKQIRTINDFKRSLAVVAGAIARAAGYCEMPGCSTKLFQKDDGQNFLEVHHIVPLGENGDDTLANAAAICPMCHRELHFGALRFAKREVLSQEIHKKEK